jgi:hypothetical protein
VSLHNRKECLVAFSLLCYGMCACNGTAQPVSGEHGGGGTSPVASGAGPSERNISVIPLPEATFSGFPGERVVVGGEEKRIWSTAPRSVVTPSPVPTYQVYPYVILPSDKTR